VISCFSNASNQLNWLRIFALGAFVALCQAPDVEAEDFGRSGVHLGSHELKELLQRAEQTEDRFAEGKFKGEKLENSYMRSLIALTSDEKRAMGIDPRDVAFANFRHHGKFFIATIEGLRVDGTRESPQAGPLLETAAVVRERWAYQKRPEARDLEVHSEMKMRFTREGGVKLIFDQSENRNVPPATPKVREVAYSIEAVRPATNPKADLYVSAMSHDFAAGYLFFSWEERDRLFASAGPDHHLTEHPLRLEKTKSLVKGLRSPLDALLFKAITTSVERGRKSAYHCGKLNCTNALLETIDAALQPVSGIDQAQLKANVNEVIIHDGPKLAKATLDLEKSRGLKLPSKGKTAFRLVAATSPPSSSSSSAFSACVNQFLIHSLFDKNGKAKKVLQAFPPFLMPNLKARGLVP
jgi:hypothetical protein